MGDRAKRFDLTLGEHVQVGRPGGLGGGLPHEGLDEASGHGRREQGLAAGDDADGREEIL